MICSLCNYDSGGSRANLARHKSEVHSKKGIIVEKVELKDFTELLKLEKVTVKNAPLLDGAGFTTIELIAQATIKELVAVETVGDVTAEAIKAEAIELTGELDERDNQGDGCPNEETSSDAKTNESTTAIGDEEVGAEGSNEGESEPQV